MATCMAASAVKFCQTARDFFSKFYRDLNSIFFFIEFVFWIRLMCEPLILDAIFLQKLHFNLYLNRLIGEHILVRFTMFGFKVPMEFFGEYENYTFLESS